MRIAIKAVAGGCAIGAALLMAFEGFAPEAMQPLPGDKWTIGYGHTEGVSPGDVITQEDAAELLEKDLQKYAAVVGRCVVVPLTEKQLGALISLVYNIGERAFCSSSLLSAINSENRAETARQWMRWVYFKGKPVQGLVNRRRAELECFQGGRCVNSTAH